MKKWITCDCGEPATELTGLSDICTTCEKCYGRMCWCARRGHTFKSTPSTYGGYLAQRLQCTNCGYEDYDLQDFKLIPPPRKMPLIPLIFPICMECGTDATTFSGLHNYEDLCRTCHDRMAWCARRGHTFLRKAVYHKNLASLALFCTSCHYKTIESCSFNPVPERKRVAQMPAGGHGDNSRGKSGCAYLRLVKPTRPAPN